MLADDTHPRSSGSLTGKLRQVLAGAGYWPRTLRLISSASPRETTVWATLLVVQGALPVAAVFLMKLLVEQLVTIIGAGADWAKVQPALVLLALNAGVALLAEIVQSATEWLRVAQSERVEDHVKSLLHEQSAEVDLAFYDSADYYDHLEQVRNEAGSRPVALLEQVGSFIQNGITLVAMAAVLVLYNPWLPAVLVVSTLPALLVVLRYDRRYHRWWQGTTAERRRAQYFDSVLTSPITAAELRLFDLGDYFRSGYQTVRRRLRLERLEHVQQQSLARLAAGGAALLVTGLALAWMLWRATLGMVTLGDLVLLYQAFQRGQGLMRNLLANVSQIYSNTLFLEHLFAFLDLRAQVTDPVEARPTPPTLTRGITFRDVTFRYPGAERPALQDFTLSIPTNKVIAIVGANGAGKSTLLKLLCRLYDPEAGRVELDGVDVRDLSVKELRRMITVLFQFPVAYQATAAQNIELGDVRAAPGMREIKVAARAAGVDDAISRLPRGYDTHLGKWFADGAELSGGEWQKVAMARAFLRQAPIIVLDEPTSFMDSWAEADWFDRFRALAQGRAGLIITHRFTIAMRADCIHVMDQGRIVESGSHQELLASGGLYAQSWMVQMQAASAAAVEQVA